MINKDELQEELRKLDAQLQEIRKKKEQTADDIKKVNELCDQMEEIVSKLEAEERAEGITASLNKPKGKPAGLGQPNEGEQRGFENFGEYLQAVARASSPAGQMIAGLPCGVIDRRLIYQSAEQRSSGAEESTPSLGGFLVQKDFGTDIIKKAHDTAMVFNKVRKIPISANSNGLKIPFIDETSRANGSRWGGIRAYWLEEGGTKTDSKPKFGLLELSLKKLIGLCYATDELLQDASALGAVITEGFAEEIGFKLDDAMLNGTGAGQPLGILNAACLVTVAKETGQTAKTIIWENIKKMYAQMWPRSLVNGGWLINQNCWTELMNMSIPTGTGGIPVWLPANLAQGRPNSTLMGMPVMAVEQCQTLGTKGDVYLADWTQYLAITKGALQSASSIHVKFTTDEMTFRFIYRVDGQPIWNNSMTPYKDASTSKPVSPFLALANRA